jgi:hypothetical protein
VCVGLWNHIQVAAGDRPIPVFTVIPILYTIDVCQLESLSESLLESVLESRINSLHESLLERASHQEE